MMDHITLHSKDDDQRTGRESSQNVNESDESVESSYYYDDSSNYEVYQDDDEGEDDCSVTPPTAELRP